MKNVFNVLVILFFSGFVFGQQPIYQNPIYQPSISVFMSYIDLCDDRKDIYLQLVPNKGYNKNTKSDIIPTSIVVQVNGERKNARLVDGRYEIEFYNYTSVSNKLDVAVSGFDSNNQLIVSKNEELLLERDGMIRVSDHLYKELESWRNTPKSNGGNNIIYHFCGKNINRVELLAFFQEFLDMSKEEMCTYLRIYQTETFASAFEEDFHNILVGELCDKFDEYLDSIRPGGGGDEDECSCKIIKSSTHVRHSDGNEFGLAGESTSESCPDVPLPREGSLWYGKGSTYFDTYNQNDWGNVLWGWQGAAKMLTIHGHLTNHNAALESINGNIGYAGEVSSSLSFSMYCYDPVELGPANDSDCSCTKDVSIEYRYASQGIIKGEASGYNAKFNGTIDDRAYLALVKSNGEKLLNIGQFSMTIGCESTDTTTWIQDINTLKTAIETAADISLGNIPGAISAGADLVLAVNHLDPFHGGCGTVSSGGKVLLDSTIVIQLTPDNYSVTATIGSVVEGVLNLENDNVDGTMSICSDFFMVGILVTDQDSTSDNCCNELVGSYVIGDLGEFENDNQGQAKFNGLFNSPTSLTFKQQLVAGHLLTSGGVNFGILVFPNIVCCQPKVDCYYDCGYYGNCTEADSSEYRLIHFDPAIGSDVRLSHESDIKLYPTPISEGNNLKVEIFNNIVIKDFQLLDLNGSLIKNYKELYLQGSYEINLMDTPSGIYILRFTTDANQIITKRILIK